MCQSLGLTPFSPKAIFTPHFLQALGISTKELDIHAKEFGHMLNFNQHRGAVTSVHSQGWNEDWKGWIAKQQQNGVQITASSIKQRFSEMKALPRFRQFYRLGVPAKYPYRGWKVVEDKIRREVNVKIAKLLSKRAVKISSKRVPLIGIGPTVYFFVDDCKSEGLFAASRDAIIGSIPYVGTAYGVYQLSAAYSQADDMIDEEMTARVYTGDY